jgi:hypothetical protein
MGNIKFEIFPVTPWRFDILEIESKKKKISCGRRAVQGALSFFGEVWNRQIRSEAIEKMLSRG